MAGITKYRIGKASAADWPHLAVLQNACFYGDPTRLSEVEFEKLLTGEGGKVIVARAGLRPVGYIVMRHRRFLPWESLAFVAVDPGHRGAGVAKQLTIAASALSPKLFVRLHVRPSNKAALTVYRALGFRVTERKNKHYPDGEDALVMMRWNGFTFWRVSLPATSSQTVVSGGTAD